MFGQIVNCPKPVFSACRSLRFITPLLALLSLQLAQNSNPGVSGYPSFIQTSLQGAAAQSSPEVIVLEAGKVVERDLAGGQRHVYQITLTEGQYFKVEVKQLSSTVLISLQPPDSKTLNVHDLPERKEVLTIEWVAGAPGVYRLDIYSRAKTPAGRYEIRVAQVRPATEDERALQRARSLYQEYFQLNRAGKYLEARPLMLHALEIRERVLGADHIEVAETLEIIVHNYMLSGDYASAEPLGQRALIIKERALGPEHPDMVNAFYERGIFLYYKGDHLKAEEMFLKALSIVEKTNSPQNLIVAYVLTVLGDIYYDRGDYTKADYHHQRSLSVQEKNLGAGPLPPPFDPRRPRSCRLRRWRLREGRGNVPARADPQRESLRAGSHANHVEPEQPRDAPQHHGQLRNGPGALPAGAGDLREGRGKQ